MVFIFVLIVSCIIRRRYRQSQHLYGRVNHDLDDEEIEFRTRIIDSVTDDDIDALFTDAGDYDDNDDEEIDFDTRDIDRLSILEKYRSTLSSSEPSGYGRVATDEDSGQDAGEEKTEKLSDFKV